MAAYTQDRRIARLETPFGKDALVLTRFDATEGVSELFEYRIEALSAKNEILNFDDALGKSCSVAINTIDGGQRWFDGVLTEALCLGVGNGGIVYRLVLRPWLWLLTRRKNALIFHDKHVNEILQAIFREWGRDVIWALKGKFPKMEYCVQYRESDFAFVSRLMEQHGISYHFRHEKGEHKLVVSNDVSGWKEIEGTKRPYYPMSEQHLRKEEHFFHWMPERRFTTGAVSFKDYNFKTPGNKLLVRKDGDAKYTHPKIESYDYPGKHTNEEEGNFYAKVRVDGERGADHGFLASGDCPSLFPGAIVKLEKHPITSQNREYVALRCTHTLVTEEYRSGGTADISEAYHGSYELMTADQPYVPPVVTEKPYVHGPQTAVVVGDSEIPLDKFGRVKVQFHWDREGKRDSKSSCWLRVATSWAGNGWGMISLPRIGQEVVVAFLEGDPDQPLIVGSVYNAEQKTPYELPANATVSTVKSRSKKGSASQFNELRFEDKAGNEYVLFHAQKDRLEFVEETLKSEIGKDEHRTVIGDRKEFILGEHHLQVSKDVKQRFDTKLNLSVGEDILIETTGQHSLEAATDITAKSGTAYSIDAGTDLHAKAAMNVGVDGGMNVHIKGGMNVVVEGGIQVTLKAGPSSVVLGPDGVSITGPMVKINSGGAPGSGSGASPVAPTAPDAPDEAVRPEDPLSHR